MNIKKIQSINITLETNSPNESLTEKEVRSSSNSVFRMRKWQAQAFEELKDAPFMILNAPMGSGKSSMMCYIAAFKLHQDPLRKCIISVPQEIIGPGFSVLKLPIFQMPDGTSITWDIVNNLCLSGSRKRDQLIEWLQQTGKSLPDKVLLCTHATLVSAFKYLKSSGKESLLNKLLIWIDEAHHVMNAFTEEPGKAISNGIGSLVDFALNQAFDINLGLTTATFIRGDRYTLLTQIMKDRFHRFDLPYDDYLSSCEHLKSFSYNFAICEHDYIHGISEIIKTKKCKDIIYIPHTISRYSTKNKHKETSQIIDKYSKLHETTDPAMIL